MQKNNNINAVYCKNKFTYLKIDIEKRLLYNCHKAYPHQIRSQWLSDNPGKIFNTNIMLQEREQMLNGKRNSSCAYACYRNEDHGSPSERQIIMKDIDVIDITKTSQEPKEPKEPGRRGRKPSEDTLQKMETKYYKMYDDLEKQLRVMRELSTKINDYKKYFGK